MPAAISEQAVTGYVLAALVLIVGFAATVIKLYKPLQNLNINIAKLTTVLQFVVNGQKILEKHIERHDEQLVSISNLLTECRIKIEQFELFEKEVRTHEHNQT